MERLPYIDQHSRLVAADRAHTWTALLRTTCKNPDDLNTLPHGFSLDESDPPKRLAAEGQHRFSRYALTFTLEEVDSGHTRLVADSYGAFPGLGGRIYRALVVGSGGHALIVRDMVRRIGVAAEKLARTERRS
ncbi:hypothetical protein [Nocardia huaxiensis]|uniref:hypothetical protein n=1 Tax=Nocardia huaxiensis TaxID=2755382 RepID=UPI001E4131DC|nr:hypothetical protein [Nocardia huaxiensis]UFS94748.1 hypothetical protein LPY97_29010 [Nocardia huaxiensis]